MSLKVNAEAAGLKAAYDFIDRNPQENIPKVMGFLDTVLPDSVLPEQRAAVKAAISAADSNWYNFMMSLFTDIDNDVRKTLFINFVINGTVRQQATANEYQERYDCNIPWAILLDPTSACNLHCTGCWAAEYGSQLNDHRLKPVGYFGN